MIKETKLIMGMPVTVALATGSASRQAFDKVFSYFEYVDETFSTYKETSEISKINRGELTLEQCSADTQTILRLSEETKRQTDGYFDIVTPNGSLDPSGLVKGWAIQQAALLLEKDGYDDFFIDAGGDTQTRRNDLTKKPWSVGIRNPFNREELVKVLYIRNEGVATSGTYIRGPHIYNPHNPREQLNDMVSLTVVGPNVYEADRFATAAFAMGRQGVIFIENLLGFEGYAIDKNGTATTTSGFTRYTQNNS